MVSLILVDSNNQILQFFNNPWWTIAGPISLIIGFISLYAAFRKKRNKIEHAILKSFDIGKGLNKEFPNLTLSYKNAPITNYVWILRGSLKMCDDIKMEKDNNEIELLLPNECNVLEVKIISSNDKFTVGHYLKDRIKDEEKCKNTVVFKIKSSEWKEQENFKYSIIFETPSLIESIEDHIKLEQRFHNTETVIIDSSTGQRKVSKILAFAFFAFSLFFILLALFVNKPLNKEDYTIIILYFITSVLLFIYSTKKGYLSFKKIAYFTMRHSQK